MRTELDQIEQQAENEPSVAKYSCSMHPITQLTIPDFMDQDRSSMIDTSCTILYAMMPMTINYALNYASALINIYFVGIATNKQTFSQICLGTVIANICVFYLIEYVGAGFAIVCSYFSAKEKEEVGYLYQKTLGVTFLICVVMTPVVYLTDKLFYLLNFDHNLVQYACAYAWALVPSFYLYSFIDTNKNYLLSQGIIFPPIVIHFASAAAHLAFCLIFQFYRPLGILSAAWIKNISDSICALSIYLFIILKEPTKESWVEWSLKSTNNLGRFLKEVVHHQAYTYVQLVAFQLLCIIACRMDYSKIAAHFSFAILYMLIYFLFNSLSQCVSRAIAVSIEEGEGDICKKKISMGVLLALLLSFVIAINIFQHRAHFTDLFTADRDVAIEMQTILVLFCAIVVASALNVTLLGIVKTLQLQYIWGYSFVVCYIIGLTVSVVLCYGYNHGLWGIWAGWLSSLILELYINLKRIICLDFEQTYSIIRDRYKIIRDDARISKHEMTHEIQEENRK